MSRPLRSIESIRNTAALRDAERKADAARGAFLRALDESDYLLEEWEKGFVTNFLDFTSNRPSDEPRWWTDPRRLSCDRMMSHYYLATQ